MSYHELLHITIHDPLTTRASVPIIGFTLLSFFARAFFIFLMIVPSPELVAWAQLVSACLAIVIGIVTISRWIVNYVKKRKDVKNTEI